MPATLPPRVVPCRPTFAGFGVVLVVAAALLFHSIARTSHAASLVTTSSQSSATAGGVSSAPLFSRDGKVLAFLSSADNLVTNDANGNLIDLFVRDLATGVTQLVSVNTNGVSGNGPSHSAALSANGQIVAFVSQASDLVDGDTNRVEDVFVRDLARGVTRCLSRAPDGPAGDRESRAPAISADGRWVVFEGRATNLALGGAVDYWNVYLAEVATGALRCLSPKLAGIPTLLQPDGNSLFTAISDDGNIVAFTSDSKHLVNLPLVNGFAVVSGLYVWTAAKSELRMVTMFPGSPEHHTLSTTDHPVLSADGRRMLVRVVSSTAGPEWPKGDYWIDLASGAFQRLPTEETRYRAVPPILTEDGGGVVLSRAVFTNSANLSPLETILWTASTGETKRLSEPTEELSTGAGLSAYGRLLDASRDGTTVAFLGNSTNASSSDADGVQIVVRRLATGEMRSISRSLTGSRLPGNGSAHVSVSGDGNLVAFTSLANNLVPDDANNAHDVFLYDWTTDRISLVSGANPSLPSRTATRNAQGAVGGVSADGRRIAFVRDVVAAEGAAGAGGTEVALWDSATGTTQSLGVKTDGLPATPGVVRDPVLSADGQWAAFVSTAGDLAEGDDFVGSDVFLRDLENGVTTLVSRRQVESRAGGISIQPAISPDHAWVAFASKSQAFSSRDNNTFFDIYLSQRETGTILLVTSNAISASLTAGDGDSLNPAFTADGRWLVYESRARNLVNPSPSGLQGRRLFAREMATGRVLCLDKSADVRGSVIDGLPPQYALSPDGGFVAFTQDSFSSADLYLHELASGTTSVLQASARLASVSRGATFISYLAVAPADQGTMQVFLLNRAAAGPTGARLISAAPDGTPGNGPSSHASVSPDGRFVVFASRASNLVAGDDNDQNDLFLHDTASGTTVRLSSTLGGKAGNAVSTSPVLSADGNTVVFTTFASDLIEGDFNQRSDVLLVRLPGAGSDFRVTTITRSSDGQVTLVWPVEAGKTYRVQATTDLTAAWSDLAIPVTLQGSQATAIDPAAGHPHRFYRALKTEN